MLMVKKKRKMTEMRGAAGHTSSTTWSDPTSKHYNKHISIMTQACFVLFFFQLQEKSLLVLFSASAS